MKKYNIRLGSNKLTFMLIETIIIVTILILVFLIIICLLMPHFEDSGKKKCQEQSEKINQDYNDEVKKFTADNPQPTYLNFNLIENAIATAGGTNTDGSAVKITIGVEKERKPTTKSKIYGGVCPNGGQYQIDLKDEGYGEGAKTVLSIACTHPGHTEAQVDNTQVGLKALKDTINKPGSGAVKYFSSNSNAVTLFSTDTLSAGSPQTKAIEEINGHFSTMGLDPLKIGSWRIDHLMVGGYDLFWSAQNSEGLEPGASVVVTKYHIETDRYYSGKAQVKAQNGIHILSIPDETVNWPEITK